MPRWLDLRVDPGADCCFGCGRDVDPENSPHAGDGWLCCPSCCVGVEMDFMASTGKGYNFWRNNRVDILDESPRLKNVVMIQKFRNETGWGLSIDVDAVVPSYRGFLSVHTLYFTFMGEAWRAEFFNYHWVGNARRRTKRSLRRAQAA